MTYGREVYGTFYLLAKPRDGRILRYRSKRA